MARILKVFIFFWPRSNVTRPQRHDAHVRLNVLSQDNTTREKVLRSLSTWPSIFTNICFVTNFCKTVAVFRPSLTTWKKQRTRALIQLFHRGDATTTTTLDKNYHGYYSFTRITSHTRQTAHKIILSHLVGRIFLRRDCETWDFFSEASCFFN